MMQENWKSIEEYIPSAKKPYAYEIDYIVPFGIDLVLSRKEHIRIISSSRLTDEIIIEKAIDCVCERFENDDQYKLIPDISIESIIIVNRYCPKSEIVRSVPLNKE